MARYNKYILEKAKVNNIKIRNKITYYLNTRGMAIITTHPLLTKTSKSGEDPETFRRWSYSTFTGINNNALTTINAYRPCKENNQQGVSTTNIQY